jgi:hypothetical protein
MLFRKILRDPLVHLLFLCTGIFALHYQAISSVAKKETIVVNDEMAQRVISRFQNQWNRLPTEAEWKELIDAEIREEIYHRQALKKNPGQQNGFFLTRRHEKPDIFYGDQTRQEFIPNVYNELKKQYRVEFKISDRNLNQQLEANFPVAFKK